MEIEYQFRGLSPRKIPDRPMDRLLESFGTLIPIRRAVVVLEHQRQSVPPFCAAIDLGVPGADIRAAARDHTLEAALFKVARRLEEAILNRRTEEDLRHKTRRNSRVVVDQLTS